VFVGCACGGGSGKERLPGFADSGDRYGEEGARGRRAGGKLKKSLSAEDI